MADSKIPSKCQVCGKGGCKICAIYPNYVEERGFKKGVSKGVSLERMEAIKRMLKANATNEQIISYGYTEEEIQKVENELFVTV